MVDARIDKLAQVLVEYSVGIKPRDKVLIQGSAVAESLLKVIVSRVLQAGGFPLTVISLAGGDEILYRYGSDEQLSHIPEPMKVAVETYDASISLMSSENTKGLSNVPPEKMVVASRARTELMKTMMQRAGAGELRWVGTLFPTNAYAQDAEMSLGEYEDFVFSACLPNPEDPVGYWKEFSLRQQKIVDFFAGKERVHVTGPDIDLRLSVAGRRFINCDGKNNMPDGEVFTGPVEESVEGHVRFSYPTTYQGRRVDGVQLWFENGKVVRAEADKNEEFLLRTIDTDAGSRYVGEFAIGTNKGISRATGNTLFDEKIGGSFHIALGAGYPESGSKNESSIHWDIICDLKNGGEIRVDDDLVYKNGEFLIDF